MNRRSFLLSTAAVAVASQLRGRENGFDSGTPGVRKVQVTKR